MTLAGEYGQERAISCLEQLRSSAIEEQLSKYELLNKLDSLEILILEDYDRQRDLLLSAENRLARYETKVVKRERRQTPNYSLPRDILQNSSTLATRNTERESLEPEITQDEESEGDDSFARLSTMLERSISIGQDALTSSQPRTLDPVYQSSDRLTITPAASSLDLHDQTLATASPMLTDCLEHKHSNPASPQNDGGSHTLTRPLRAAFDTNGTRSKESRMFEEGPPSYRAQADPATKPATTMSLVDDGVMALESLIDQLASSTLAGRNETGLTSNKILVFGSLMVLLLSFLISRHGADLGVSCHCICLPTATTTT